MRKHLQVLTRDVVREIAHGAGWKVTPRHVHDRSADNILDPWIYLSKQSWQDETITLHCRCREGSIWIGAPEDHPNIAMGPVLDTHISDPESIIKIQKYLRDRC
jgi:hypothetical protein